MTTNRKRLTEKQPLEVWQREAGMNWQIQDSPVHFKAEACGHLGSIHTFPEQKVLYRSDTKEPLSVVSHRYQVVQPRDVLEFYRDLTEFSGYELETAGVLKGGRKFWALAKTGQTTALNGNDQVDGYGQQQLSQMNTAVYTREELLDPPRKTLANTLAKQFLVGRSHTATLAGGHIGH